MKFTKSGFIKISAKIKRNKNSIKVSIIDSGVGIKEHEIEFTCSNFKSDTVKTTEAPPPPTHTLCLMLFTISQNYTHTHTKTSLSLSFSCELTSTQELNCNKTTCNLLWIEIVDKKWKPFFAWQYFLVKTIKLCHINAYYGCT